MGENYKNRKTIVIGHKNPDTDSICSAICYANLKRKLTGEEYQPGRAGHVNEETQFVLHYFEVEAPELVENVKTQVRDMETDAGSKCSHHPDGNRGWDAGRADYGR